MDGIPIVDFSPMSLSVDDERLNECDLKSAAEQFMKAFTTCGVVRLINTGLNEQTVCIGLEFIPTGLFFLFLYRPRPKHTK